MHRSELREIIHNALLYSGGGGGGSAVDFCCFLSSFVSFSFETELCVSLPSQMGEKEKEKLEKKLQNFSRYSPLCADPTPIHDAIERFSHGEFLK